MTKAYTKDYSKVLACIPLAMAQAMVSRLEASDEADTVNFNGDHLFRDDLLFLMDLSAEEIMNAIVSSSYTQGRYPSLYAGMAEEDVEYHFQNMIKPLLLLKLELGL